uniref:Fungal lipase-type domain-containing protein n=1 Tax=Pseudo-nitzschia australis TaxID=44445 RepID=A0A7S4EFW8_9STRA|eukprot:CAMPEP_0168182734 /NCGR_PEP_ID=MMETSP0139_2-20121125/12052_1 /TAXON_ID=44445 /ORGANISM="Pseudo-nitzschia australis, Strain 10249 10 AB" /LENGTH=418 /DNA_ID=CAMNT_0008103685 /DNA_START=149 /DNA_END=1405 /DNA_ORIENTATION=-
MPEKQDLEVFFEDMLVLSSFCYDFNSLRGIVKEHDGKMVKTGGYFSRAAEVKFERPELILTSGGDQDKHVNRQLKYDITPAAVLEFIRSNRKLFQDSDGDGSLEFDPSQTEKPEPYFFETVMEDQCKDNLKIIDYDDKFSTGAGGLVYGVMVNLTKKWVTVVFRGTVGIADINTDRDFTLNSDAMFPNEEHKFVEGGNPATHNGFTSYLFSHREKDVVDRPYTARILACLDKEFGSNPEIKGKDFKLFVTGHSLGGGMANLFAFRVAQLKAMGHEHVKHFPKMVKAMTFASPVVGNEDYNKEFQYLEKNGFLRHIRIANEGDVVPTNNIYFPYSMAIAGDTSLYIQNGVNFFFNVDKKADISYGNTKGMWSQFGITTSLGYHGLNEYHRRYKLPCNADLYDDTIEEMYKKATNNFSDF